MSQFKITSPDQKLARRLRFPTTRPSYATLTAKILSLWGSSTLTASTLGLSYVDRDGDRCVLSSDEELDGLYDELSEEGKADEVVKLRVVVLGEGEGGERGLGGEGDLLGEREAEEAPVTFSEAAQEERPSGPGEMAAETSVATEATAEQAASAESSVETAAGEQAPATPSSDAPDPPDEFPTSSSAGPSPASSAQPSLLDDLSSLFSSVAGSPALSALLARAASGAYTPSLASAVHSRATSAATQAAVAQAEIERVLGQVHVQLRESGLDGVDEKLREVEALTAGWTAQLKDGLREVQILAERRRAAADPGESRPAASDKETQADVNMDASNDATFAPSADATAAPAPHMPGAFTPPITSLFDGFEQAQATSTVPPAPSAFAPLFDAFAPRTFHATSSLPSIGGQANRFSPPPGPPPHHHAPFYPPFDGPPSGPAGGLPDVCLAPGSFPPPLSTSATDRGQSNSGMGGGLFGRQLRFGQRRGSDELNHQQRRLGLVPGSGPGDNGAQFRWRRHGQGPPHGIHAPKSNPVRTPKPQREGVWVDGEEVEAYKSEQAASEAGMTTFERALAKLTEMSLMDESLPAFLQGVLATSPHAAMSELVLAGLKYHAHGFATDFFELGPAAAQQTRSDGRTFVGARDDALGRLAEMGLDQDRIRHLVNGQLAVDPSLAVEHVVTSTVRLAFQQV